MLSLTRLHRNIRSLRRYRQVLGVLVKYGFGQILDQLPLGHLLERGRQLLSRRPSRRTLEQLTPAVRLRMAMEELGPTFVKLGQLLSTRPDLIPQEYVAEFSKLQDRVPPFPLSEVELQIERQLGSPVGALFLHFDAAPLAAASMAQVHRAVLKSGAEVVVKVRRPGIEQVIATDLDILMGLAVLAERHLPSWHPFDPVGLVKAFRRTLNREMDFSREGHTIERFAANFRDDPTVHVPRLYRELCGETVLTMEFIDGIKVNEFDRLRIAGYDLQAIARHGADALLTQVLVHGLFHGDPHPGNLYILPDNVICFLDYGMVGRLDRDMMYQLVDLLGGILQRDVEKVTQLLLYSGELEDELVLTELKKAVHDFIDDYYELPLQEIHTGQLLVDFIDLLAQFRIKFPPDLLLLARALITMEGIGRQLDPQFNMVQHLKPFLERLARERLAPGNLGRELLRVLQGYGGLLRSLPQELRELLNRLRHNKIKIDLEHRGLDHLITDLDKSSNRLSFSMLISALIIGSSLVMLTDKGPLLFGFPVMGLIGYSVAGLLGLWLAIAILRSGRL